jgi:hypothetical protein
MRLLLAIFRPIGQLRIGPIAYCTGFFIGLMFWAYGHGRVALAIVVGPIAWHLVAAIWWVAFRFWARRQVRRMDFVRTDVRIPPDVFGDTFRMDLTGGSRLFRGDREPQTPTFAYGGGHAVVVGAPRGSSMPQVGVWATSIRMVDDRPWYTRMTIHPRGWLHVLTFAHVRLPAHSAMPGFIFRDRKVVDFGRSQEVDLESTELSHSRRFVLDQGETPFDVAYAIDPPTIEWLLERPYLEFELRGRDLVVFDPRGPLRALSMGQLLAVAEELCGRLSHTHTGG